MSCARCTYGGCDAEGAITAIARADAREDSDDVTDLLATLVAGVLAICDSSLGQGVRRHECTHVCRTDTQVQTQYLGIGDHRSGIQDQIDRIQHAKCQC